MFRVKLINTPDIIGCNIISNCIKLYSLKDLVIPVGVAFYTIDMGFNYDFGENVIGVPYVDKECTQGISLYHPKGSFRWRGARQATLVVNGVSSEKSSLEIPKGNLLAKVNLMSIQYFNLWKKANGADKGLKSCSIKIELINENV